MANTIPHAATGAKCSSLQKAFIRELLMAQDPEGYCANCRAIEHATAPEYGLVKVPLLIIAGDEDKSAPLEGCRYIHDHVSSKEKQLEVLEGVGHWHCIEAPDDVGRLVARFCDSLT